MAAGTAVTVVVWPVYAALYHWHGVTGLAVASDLGITLQTVTIAVLLHRRRMVSLAGLDYAEMGRCLLAGAVSGGVVWTFVWGLGYLPIHAMHSQIPAVIRWTDLALLVAGAGIWVVLAKWVLEKTGSSLPREAIKRLGIR